MGLLRRLRSKRRQIARRDRRAAWGIGRPRHSAPRATPPQATPNNIRSRAEARPGNYPIFSSKRAHARSRRSDAARPAVKRNAVERNGGVYRARLARGGTTRATIGAATGERTGGRLSSPERSGAMCASRRHRDTERRRNTTAQATARRLPPQRSEGTHPA